MAERYPGKAGRSEYGGGDGVIQRMPSGGSLDLPGIAASSGDRAMLMRKAGIHDFDPARSDFVGLAVTDRDLTLMGPAEREAYENDLLVSARRALERQELMASTNGYIAEPDQYVGEDASGGAGWTTDAAAQSADPVSPAFPDTAGGN